MDVRCAVILNTQVTVEMVKGDGLSGKKSALSRVLEYRPLFRVLKKFFVFTFTIKQPLLSFFSHKIYLILRDFFAINTISEKKVQQPIHINILQCNDVGATSRNISKPNKVYNFLFSTWKSTSWLKHQYFYNEYTSVPHLTSYAVYITVKCVTDVHSL